MNFLRPSARCRQPCHGRYSNSVPRRRYIVRNEGRSGAHALN
jgi:hypothetical protein